MTAIFKILRKNHINLGRRFALLFAYLKLRSKRFFVNRTRVFDKNSASFLGYDIKVGIYNDFFWTFLEIFVEEDYYFETNNSSPNIIDCGANIGMAILYFKWLYPESKILAFEIEPENLEVLKFNIEKNDLTRIEVVEKAVGAEEGHIKLQGNRRAGSISPELIAEQVKKESSYDEHEAEVEITKLSNYLDEEVDFLKMDIEGAEADVFTDLGESRKMELIEKTTLEFHRFSSGKNRLSAILKVLEDYNFDVVFPDNPGHLSNIKRSYYNFMVRAGKRHWDNQK